MKIGKKEKSGQLYRAILQLRVLRYCEKCLLPQAAAEYRAALEASRPLPAFRAELSYRVTPPPTPGRWRTWARNRPGPPPLSRSSGG